MNKTITDLFFDLDHTLWDFDRNSALAFEYIFKKEKIEVDIDLFLKHYQPINLNYWKLYREEKVDKNTLRFERLNKTFNAINYPVDSKTITILSEQYIANLTRYNYLFDDTLELLEYLKPKYRLHIITNGFEEVQQTKLEKSNIAHYFETVTNSEMVGVKKPNPKIFNFALNLANTKIEKSVMIGDNYEADILGALNIGLDAICFNYHKENLPVALKQVTRLSELKTML